MAIVTAEWSLGAFLTLVFGNEVTLERLPTTIVAALNYLYKGTAIKLFLTFRVDIQVFVEHF